MNKAEQFINALESKLNDLERFLSEGVDEASIKKSQRLSGVKIPIALLELYQITDGEGIGVGLFGGYQFLTFKRMLSETLDIKDPTIHQKNLINPDISGESLLPFAHDGSGQYLCIDNNPNKEGKVGQILYVPLGEPEAIVVISHSFDDFLDILIKTVLNEEFYLTDDREEWSNDEWEKWKNNEDLDLSWVTVGFEGPWRDDWIDLADKLEIKELSVESDDNSKGDLDKDMVASIESKLLEFDYSDIDSKTKVLFLFEKGELDKIHLMPLDYGGRDIPINTLYVPPFVQFYKQRFDETIGEFLSQGRKLEYVCEPKYENKSLVPVRLKIKVKGDLRFKSSINIWKKPKKNIESKITKKEFEYNVTIESLDNNLKRIDSWLENHANKIFTESLGPPVNEKQIMELEKEVGLLPDDFKALYRWHNGLIEQKDLNSGNLFYSMQFYSIKSVLHSNRRRGFEISLESADDGIDMESLFNSNWLTFARGSDTELRLDLTQPGEGIGKYGQVIFIDEEYRVGIKVADSISELIANFLSDLENDLYYLNADGLEDGEHFLETDKSIDLINWFSSTKWKRDKWKL